MSEYLHVEKPFLTQPRELDWEAIDQGCGSIPSDPAASLRESFRQVMLSEVFRESVRSLNLTDDGQAWLTDRQLDDPRDQLFRQGAAGLLEANEFAHRLLQKAQVDVNEVTGEAELNVPGARSPGFDRTVRRFRRVAFGGSCRNETLSGSRRLGSQGGV